MQLVWSGPVFGTNAYAKSAQNILANLHKLGLDIKITVEESTFIHLRNSQEMPSPILLHMLTKPNMRHRVHIHHTTPEQFRIDENSKNLGITYCETNRVSDIWVRECNKLDLLLLGSTHNEVAFQTSGVFKPIALLPHGVDITLYSPEGPKFDFQNELIPMFKFLSVSEWTFRKGFELLVQAFCEEFTRKDDVTLIIKTIHRQRPTGKKIDISCEVREMVHRYVPSPEMRAPIYIYSGILDDKDLSALYRSCDAFVLPSRGEGIGLPYLEAASCKIPVIATAWGGQMDVLTSENSFLCDYELMPITAEHSNVNPWHASSMMWAEPNLKSLRKQMRLAYQDASLRTQRAKSLLKIIYERYTWANTARMLADYIHNIACES